MRFFRLSPALLSVATVLASGCTPTSVQVTPVASPYAAAIDGTAQRLFSLGASPGLGIVVVRDTEVIYLRGFGYADVERQRPVNESTEFYIASTTKSFTGLASALLAERGSWSLDAPLSKYLPDVRLKAPLNADSITIRSLLTHTHGIGNGGPVAIRLAYTGEYRDTRELVELLSTHPAAPSRNYAYSNLGYNVAAFAMESVTGESWKETLQRMLFDPLGMTSTSAYVSKTPADRIAKPYRLATSGFVSAYSGKTDSNMQSAGGLFSSLSDMAKWLEIHLNDGKLDGRQILPAAAVREAHKLGAPVNQAGREARQIGYSLGWQIVERGTDTLFVHGGGFSGYATHMSFNPRKRVGLVVMANNSDLGGGLVDLTAARIYDAINSGKAIDSAAIGEIAAQLATMKSRIGEDRARRAARPQTLLFPVNAYIGTYSNPVYGRLVLTGSDGKLEARMGAAWSAVEVYDAAKNQLRFELFGSGQVATVVMSAEKAATITWSGVEYTRVP